MIPTPLLAAVLTPLALSADDPVPPPGMVFLEGERVTIGSDGDVIKDKILELDGKNSAMWGETPMHEVRVDDFFLMVTEVTNEQYAEFVVATGSKPPELWGKKAIDEAQAAFLQEQGERIAEARKAGNPPPEREKFERDLWWNANWEGKEWEIPAGREAHPVVYVDYDSAEAYARWAGLRLPTEFEFQRAVRGDAKRLYPWGDEWDPSKAVSIDAGFKEARPVGSVVAGATEAGIFDLVGNVWEWTSSPYVPYPKHKTDRIKIKEGRGTRFIELICDWDPDERVTVGGSYLNTGLAARASTRRAIERFQTYEAVGFRCAATPRVGLDMATVIEAKDIDRGIRSDHRFDLTLTVAMDRWIHREGTAAKLHEKDRPSKSKDEDADEAEEWKNPLSDYAVITDYDYVLFTPVAEADSGQLSRLARDTVDGEPLVLGFLSTTAAIDEPALEPGTYVVAWRGAGRTRLKEAEPAEEEEAGRPRMRQDDEEEEDEYVNFYKDLEFDPEKENLIILDRKGRPLLALETKGLSSERLRDGAIRTSQVPADEKAGTPAHDLIVLDLAVPTGRNKGLTFQLPLKVPQGFTAGTWRKK